MLVSYAGREPRLYHKAQSKNPDKPRNAPRALKRALKAAFAADGCTSKERAEVILSLSRRTANEIARIIREEDRKETKRQSQARWFVEDFFEKHGKSPTYSELGEALGISKVAAFKLIHRMGDSVIVEFMNNRSRLIVQEAA